MTRADEDCGVLKGEQGLRGSPLGLVDCSVCPFWEGRAELLRRVAIRTVRRTASEESGRAREEVVRCGEGFGESLSFV